jgi:hypothetical protein
MRDVRGDDRVGTAEVDRMMRDRLRRARTLSLAVLAGVMTMAVASPSSGATTAARPQFVSLRGDGAWSVSQELVSWQNDLATADPWINLNYVNHGTQLARQDVIDKRVDFAISGVPFTTDQLANVNGGASAFIDAPIEVATLAMYVEPPQGGFRSTTTLCNPDDPSTWPQGVTDGSTQCILTAPYTGPIRIPSRNLGAMILHYPFGGFPPLNAWNNPDVLSAFGVSAIATGSPSAAPGFAGRSDPDEINYYMQTFVKTAAPDVWQANQQLNPNIPWDPITERVGQVSGVSRASAEQQLAQLVQGGCGVLGNCANDVAGGVAPAPPSMLKPFREAFPAQPVSLAEIRNAHGDWVAPSAAAINKAVDAGGDSSLYALTHDVAGGYPLVWVDHLYAPAHGLSIEKTEGLAMVIRYLATTGQEKANPAGEGRLPPALVTKALDAADHLVASNCTGVDRRVVSSADPGPLAPPDATAMKSMGTMLHCEAAPGSTTTATTPPVTSTANTTSSTTTTFPPTVAALGNPSATSGSVAGSGANRAGGVRSAQTPAAVTGTAPPPVAAGPSARPRAELLTVSKLPLTQPGGASGTDRLATFLLGAVLYLLVRKPVGRFARRLAT